jgi:gliding motility-associated lipoprotein GldH
MNKVITVFSLCVLAAITACQKEAYYEKTYEFPHSSWARDQKAVFKVPIQDTAKEYDFIITLRTTTDYHYNNLWIFLNTTTPSGSNAREPFQIRIQNPDGTWAGKKTGTVVEFPLNFKRRKMPEKGNYTFALEQGITASAIDEVLDIGLRVEEVSKKE